jgi:hypothetical protein
MVAKNFNYKKEYYLKNIEKLKEYSKKYRLENKERINKLSREYKLNNKHKIKEYYLKNKKEINKRTKEYYLKNITNIKKQQKKYLLENKEKIKKRNKANYLKNRKKIIKKSVEYEKIQYQTNINFKLKKILRARIRGALKGENKSKKTLMLLGVPNIEFIKKYIESKFKEGMSWEKRHLIHIDHIIPCASFDLTKPEEQSKCFHYTNLQPLWASENLAKGSKISS